MKLTDTQLIVLTKAAQSSNMLALPLPPNLKGGAANKVVIPLIQKGLLEEIDADTRTGETIWKTDRSEFPRNYCTPVIWSAGAAPQVVVAATLRVVGYDLQTGREAWTVRGISRTVCSTPVVGPDGMLYVGMGDGGSGGDPENRAQDRSTLLGKILRIDVDHPANGKPYGIPAGNPFALCSPAAENDAASTGGNADRGGRGLS